MSVASLSSSDSSDSSIEPPSDDVFDEDVDPVEEPPREPARETPELPERPPRKRRRTMNDDIVQSVLLQVRRPNKQKDVEIAENVGIAVSTFYKLMSEVKGGKHTRDGRVEYVPVKKG